jgi:hypothetical protein
VTGKRRGDVIQRLPKKDTTLGRRVIRPVRADLGDLVRETPLGRQEREQRGVRVDLDEVLGPRIHQRGGG